MMGWLIGLVARVPATVHTKLITAFLAIVVLLITVGAIALLVPEEQTLRATLRQLNQFGYDLDRLQFVAKDEVELIGQVRKDYDQFVEVVSKSVALIRGG